MAIVIRKLTENILEIKDSDIGIQKCDITIFCERYHLCYKRGCAAELFY